MGGESLKRDAPIRRGFREQLPGPETGVFGG
jgi:hypothetical protein